jgi:hypothetical protein
MLLSLSANPVPTDLYSFYRGVTPKWLPWYIWGGGVYATKYDYNTAQFFGYFGTVSVPLLAGGPVVINSLRLTGAVTGKSGAAEGALVIARLTQRTGNVSAALANIVIDRRTVSVSNVYVDVTQSAGAFVASPSANSLGIELIGEGQGIATITGLFVNLSY